MNEHQDGASWLEALRQVLGAIEGTDLTEIELQRDEFLIRIVRARADAEIGVAIPMGGPTLADAEQGSLFHVVAPLTGIFYRAASPSAKPYVSEGDWVDAETVVGLVETMKIFNEVTADRSGRVVRVIATAGQLVHPGDPLVALEPGERSVAELERGL